MQNNIEEVFHTVIENIDSLSDEQLASLAFQAWAATQERNISPFQEEIDDWERFLEDQEEDVWRHGEKL